MFSARAVKASHLKLDPVRLEILNALRKEGRAQRRELNKTVKSWDKAPKFEFKISLKRRSFFISVRTFPTGDDELVQIWWWLNDGTEAHDIPSQPLTYPLRFIWDGPGSYKAKTMPGVIGSTGGGPTGDTVRFAHVRHPGTEARDWTGLVLENRRKPFTDLVIEAIQKGLSKAQK